MRTALFRGQGGGREGGGHIGEPTFLRNFSRKVQPKVLVMMFIVSDIESSVLCCCASGLMFCDVSGDGGVFVLSVQIARGGSFLLSQQSVEEFRPRLFYPWRKSRYDPSETSGT